MNGRIFTAWLGNVYKIHLTFRSQSPKMKARKPQGKDCVR